MRIAIDAMGGDHAPEPIVKGALDALMEDGELNLVMVGDQDRIEPIIQNNSHDPDRLEYLHTTEVVDMHEGPAVALRTKKRASIFECWNLLKEKQVDGIVSAGNTGAVVAGGLRNRLFLKNVLRPGIAVMVPHANGWSVMLDVGANVHPKPEQLFQYGVMGLALAKKTLGLENPKIGLLNVGSEERKGNELCKMTAQMFRESPVQDAYYGNIEGRDVCQGLVDVIVCDGFVGNIVLKSIEGMVEFMAGAIKTELLPQLPNDLDIAKQVLVDLYSRYHYSQFGGAPLLGIDGVCLICHGGSNDRSICNAVRAAKKFVPVNRQIVQELSELLSVAR